jgi:hypothetical protein
MERDYFAVDFNWKHHIVLDGGRMGPIRWDYISYSVTHRSQSKNFSNSTSKQFGEIKSVLCWLPLKSDPVKKSAWQHGPFWQLECDCKQLGSGDSCSTAGFMVWDASVLDISKYPDCCLCGTYYGGPSENKSCALSSRYGLDFLDHHTSRNSTEAELLLDPTFPAFQ